MEWVCTETVWYICKIPRPIRMYKYFAQGKHYKNVKNDKLILVHFNGLAIGCV